MANTTKLDQKLKALFASSFLIQKKLPSKAQQKTLLAQLLKQPAAAKKQFIQILEKFEADLEEQITEKAKKLIGIKYKMKKITATADSIYQRIEMEEDQNDEADILDQLNN